MTDYLVFAEHDNGGWFSLGNPVQAHSTEAAIRTVVKTEGFYVAVPVRSFKPVKVSVVEVAPRLEFGDDG